MKNERFESIRKRTSQETVNKVNSIFDNTMKTFIIINGTTLIALEAETKLKAMDRAANICDHSQEIIVREIEDVLGMAQLRKYL